MREIDITQAERDYAERMREEEMQTLRRQCANTEKQLDEEKRIHQFNLEQSQRERDEMARKRRRGIIEQTRVGAWRVRYAESVKVRKAAEKIAQK